MKLMKRVTALFLCFLMLGSGPLNAFATDVSGNDVVVETTDPTETEEVCGECGGSDGHTENCSFNTINILNTETPAETTQPTTTITETPAEAVQPSVTLSETIEATEESTDVAESSEVVGCSECNQTEGHLETCSQYVAPAPIGCDECGQVEGHAEECSQYAASVPAGCAECGQAEGHTEGCSQYVAEAPVFSNEEQLLTTESIEEMYALVLDLMQNNPESLLALSVDEIADIRARINELDPEGDDADTRDLLDTLAVLPNGGETLQGNPIVLPAEATIGISSTWTGNSTLTDDTVWKFQNGAIVTLKNPITIPNGKTLTLQGWGAFARSSDNLNPIFIVESGGKLIISGESTEKAFTIDGKNVIAKEALVKSSGELSFKNAVIQNGKNRSVNTSGTPNGNGGGISVTATGSLHMDHCVVTRNTASLNGGGINCAGYMTISNSTISYNRAASAETGSSVVNAGRGGGFNLHGASASGKLSNVIIEQNAAMYYGGGGQIVSSASLIMEDGTVFRYNTAILHGAGALHVTADAKFTMNGGSMENNLAQTVGGAIHSSYSCVLNLNSGKILNNTANGRGGGVHVNTGGAIILGAGLIISGNRANNEATGSAANLDATGDNWSNVQKNGAHNNNGYGGGVLIDSGTCTVEGATIINNSAAVGGGGIALVMLNVSDSGLDDVLVVNFTMNSGNISNNTTEGNGAGVYLMTNKAKENIISVHGAEGTDGYKSAIEKLKDQNILTDEPVAEINGGTVSGNSASINGGGLYLGEKTKFIINDGNLARNSADDGAGVYVASGTAAINGGTMTGNEANSDGGALYISGTVTMKNGNITKNAATENGGALYITDGNFTMSNGSMNENEAGKYGGAAYIAGGNATILHGTINSNKAVQGGAVYMAAATAALVMESGTMNSNEAADDGGAVYANGGTIKIGLEACKTENADGLASCNHHTDKGAGRYHPVIKENKAADTGGGIAIANDGVVHFYCGEAKNNEALYKGVGKNVFMDGGHFYLYDGADIGLPRDPDLVIVGGQLHNECANKEYINLYYYYQNTDTETQMIGLAEYEEIMNLPDGEYFWTAPTGYTFLGWTAQGAASGNQSNEYVRNKEQYVNSGEPVEILDHSPSSTADETGKNTEKIYDGTSDKTIHLYALWVPSESAITYIDKMTGEEITHTPTSYTFSRESNILDIHPVSKSGYDLVGWYIYQDEGQNANWNNTLTDETYEPEYSNTELDYTQLEYIELTSRNAVLKLEAGYTNFGDITLIADFIPAYTDLRITKTGWNKTDENQTFLFKVTGKPDNDSLDDIEMTVTIQGDGSVLVKELPVGSYTVEEITDWSWRYTPDDETKEVQLVDSSKTEQVDFSNTRSKIYWLSGDSYCTNWWGGNDGTQVEKRKVSN